MYTYWVLEYVESAANVTIPVLPPVPATFLAVSLALPPVTAMFLAPTMSGPAAALPDQNHGHDHDHDHDHEHGYDQNHEHGHDHEHDHIPFLVLLSGPLPARQSRSMTGLGGLTGEVMPYRTCLGSSFWSDW